MGEMLKFLSPTRLANFTGSAVAQGICDSLLQQIALRLPSPAKLDNRSI
jgi:hypothetical protein